MRLYRFAMVAMAGLLICAGPALAQTYPTKPVHIVISFPPGGGMDIIARTLAEKLRVGLKQPVVVENKPGGNTALAANYVASAAADGYTLLLALDTTLTQTPVLSPVSYDPVRDFAPISQVSTGIYIIVARADAPFKSLADLVAFGKANPNRPSMAASAVSTQLIVDIFKRSAGISAVSVPYKGTAPQTQALLGGEVDVVVDNVTTYVGQINQGVLRSLATTGKERNPLLKDTPTVREAGFPQLEVASWIGLFARAGTPPDVIRLLNAEMVKTLASPDIKEKLDGMGLPAASSTPDQLGQLVKDDFARWTTAIKAAGMQAN